MMSEFSDIYQILCDFKKNHKDRIKCSQFRKKYIQPVLVKQAFDTRRINQNTDFNPRRNLQYYQRSEPFISAKTAEKIEDFFKIKMAADEIRDKYIGEPDWLDSYTRILCNAVDQTLRIEQKDFDYSDTQLEYLSELLYVRYRLRPEDIKSASKEHLKDIFLNKDERLLRRSIFVNYQKDMHKTSEVPASSNQDALINKLFDNVKASKENKEVERSVTITIKDKIVDDIVKNANPVKE